MNSGIVSDCFESRNVSPRDQRVTGHPLDPGSPDPDVGSVERIHQKRIARYEVLGLRLELEDWRRFSVQSWVFAVNGRSLFGKSKLHHTIFTSEIDRMLIVSNLNVTNLVSVSLLLPNWSICEGKYRYF